jgi:hypothetical protein
MRKIKHIHIKAFYVNTFYVNVLYIRREIPLIRKQNHGSSVTGLYNQKIITVLSSNIGVFHKLFNTNGYKGGG